MDWICTCDTQVPMFQKGYRLAPPYISLVFMFTVYSLSPLTLTDGADQDGPPLGEAGWRAIRQTQEQESQGEVKGKDYMFL